MNYTVIDNFLPQATFKVIKDTFLSADIPWYYNQGVTDPGQEGFQFTHTFYNYWRPLGPSIELLAPLLDQINPKAWLRIKANLGIKTNKHIETGHHTDYDFPCTTAVFYINTNNGYTLFEDGTKVTSVENRLVEFNSELVHTGVSQTDEQIRVVLNLNYIKEGGR